MKIMPIFASTKRNIMKLVQNKDYMFLIDEEAICKTGELYLTSIQKTVKPKSEGVIQAGDKILAYYPLVDNIQEINLPLLPNPFDLSSLENAIDFVLSRFADVFERHPNGGNLPNETIKEIVKNSVEIGYKFAKMSLPKGFSPERILEKEYVDDQDAYGYDRWVLKTIVNLEGKVELVGIYK